MAESPRERVLSALLFLSKEELLEINQKINTLLNSNIDAGDAMKTYFRELTKTNKLQAVKEYKEKTGCGLKEAKEFIDSL